MAAAGLGQRLLALARPRAPEPLPVSFDRRRIYVLPTRFGLFYAGLLAAMSLGALNYNNNPALLMAFLLAAAGIASLVSAQLQLSALSIVAVEAAPVHAGATLQLRVHARAPDARARSGLKADADDVAAVSLVLCNRTGEATLAVPAPRRGWLDVPRIRLQTTWPLGIARAWCYVWPDTPVLVYPAPEQTAPPLPGGTGDPASRRLHAAGDDVHHLRNYRTGDAQRAIAWKPSARRGTLLVREFEEPSGSDIDLDWRSLPALAYEARISRLARWVEDAERDGRRYRLHLPAQPALGPDRGPGHRHACLRALALMPDG